MEEGNGRMGCERFALIRVGKEISAAEGSATQERCVQFTCSILQHIVATATTDTINVNTAGNRNRKCSWDYGWVMSEWDTLTTMSREGWLGVTSSALTLSPSDANPHSFVKVGPFLGHGTFLARPFIGYSTLVNSRSEHLLVLS
jgi:hypothetical protein